MSMNLCFFTHKGVHIDFPYQTSTDLTYEVLNASSKEKQLDLIKRDLINCVNEDNPDDVLWYNTLVDKIKTLLYDDTFELSMI